MFLKGFSYAVLIAAVLIPATQAAPPQSPRPPQAPPLEVRVSAVEQDVAAIKQRLGMAATVPTTAPPSGASTLSPGPKPGDGWYMAGDGRWTFDGIPPGTTTRATIAAPPTVYAPVYSGRVVTYTTGNCVGGTCNRN